MKSTKKRKRKRKIRNMQINNNWFIKLTLLDLLVASSGPSWSESLSSTKVNAFLHNLN